MPEEKNPEDAVPSYGLNEIRKNNISQNFYIYLFVKKNIGS